MVDELEGWLVAVHRSQWQKQTTAGRTLELSPMGKSRGRGTLIHGSMWDCSVTRFHSIETRVAAQRLPGKVTKIFED
jgi:hypothetical protein